VSKTAATRWRSEYSNAFNEELVTSQMGRSSPEQPPLKTRIAGTASTTPGSRSNREKLQTFETTISGVEGWGENLQHRQMGGEKGLQVAILFYYD
jgi:hypothetical protein